MQLRSLGCCTVLGSLIAAVSWGSTTDPSKSTLNLSGPTDGASAWQDSSVRVLTAGNYVHLFWYAYNSDGTQDQIRYRRSADGGVTFEPTRALVSSASGKSLDFAAGDNPVVVDGSNIHLFYGQRIGSGADTHSTIQYLRSTDDGSSFGAATKVVGDYEGFFYAAAAKGGVNLLWSHSVSGAQSVNVSFSKDAGATFALSNLSSGTATWPPLVARDAFSVDDLVRDGDNVYALWRYSDGADYIAVNKMYVSASFDGGASFKPALQFNLPSANDGNPFYGTSVNRSNYTPNLAAVGTTCHLLWLNYDSYSMFGTNAYSLRTRRLSDGAILSDPIALKTYPNGLGKNVEPGELGTIIAKGNRVYVVTRDDDGTPLWYSSDSGASFSPAKLLSSGGWWAAMAADPTDPSGSKTHLLSDWASYFVSVDGATSFTGPVTLGLSSFLACDNPKLAIGSDGTIHFAAEGKFINTDDLDAFYRRLAAPKAAKTAGSLHLNDSDNGRRDNMQIAAGPGLELTSAFTIEFWVKPTPGATYDYCPVFFQKKRSSGDGSIEIGTWNGNQLYTRLVTVNASDQRHGDWMGAGVPLAPGAWSHVAVTYDTALAQDNWRIYLNGALNGKTTITTGKLMADTQPFILGDEGSRCGGFQFDFAELRLWNLARSQEQLKANMNAVLSGSEAGLAAYFQFGGSTYDSSNHGNHGILMYQEAFGAAMPNLGTVPTNPSDLDAGVAPPNPDAGTTLPTNPDAGTTPAASDAGTTLPANPDAGTTLPTNPDAGTTPAASDAGTTLPAKPDAGTTPAASDAGVRSDAGTLAAGSTSNSTNQASSTQSTSDSGGGCSVARNHRRTTAPLAWLVALGAALAGRRRRAR